MGKSLKKLNQMIKEYEDNEDRNSIDLMQMVYKAFLLGLDSDDPTAIPETLSAISDVNREIN
jgi:uncharacterized protein Yka (UPF0111/DUF47 family)